MVDLNHLDVEIQGRLETLRSDATQRGLDGVLVVGSGPARTGDLRYLANFEPGMPGHVSRFGFRGRGLGFLVVPVDGLPAVCSATAFFPPGVAVDDVRCDPDLVRAVTSAVRDRGMAHARIGLVGTDVITLRMNSDLTTALPGVEFVPCDDLVYNRRMVKSEYELDQIRTGAAAAEVAIAHVGDLLQPGLTEEEVAHEALAALRSEGVQAPFVTCQSGPERSAEPIFYPAVSDRRIASGDILHMEFNGRFGGYMIDICRTMVVGDPSNGQLHMLTTILEMLRESIAAARPGAVAEDLEALAGEIAHNSGYTDNFTMTYGGPSTYLGHGLGLGTDEPPVLVRGDKTRLAEGMVVAIEPGLYRLPVGGARIEDTVLVTSSGGTVLNDVASRAPWLE